MIPAYLVPLANHLWQSTLFAAAAGFLAVLLKNNRASVRYRLWLAASIKFLLPFSLLVSLGGQFHRRTAAPVAPPTLTFAIKEINEPFVPSIVVPAMPASVPAPDTLPIVLFCVWLLGASVSLAPWLSRWRQIRRKLREGTPLHLDIPIRVMSCAGRTEPGVFGVFRPVLLLPDGITDRLTPGELQAILTHELCHVRRRDNLAATVHMAVETLFWFHPLVWWIESRLLEEQENACDEEVLQLGNDPQVYADGILKVCRLYIASPLVCVSGITGSDLKKRIEGIMRDCVPEKLSFRNALLLIVTAIIVLTGPILVGLARPAPQAREAFEVASIKPKKFQPGMVGIRFLPGGLVRGEQAPLPMIISDAYGISTMQLDLEKVPKSVMEDLYDFEAKAGANALPTTAPEKDRTQQLRRMLQSLLADRFKLVLHKEQREILVYALSVSPNGPKFEVSQTDRKCAQESREDPFVVRFGDSCGKLAGGPASGIRGSNITTTNLIEYLEIFGDRRIIDRTGITGRFDAALPPWNRSLQFPQATPGGNPEAAAREPAVEDPNGPSIFTVIQQALGLRLESVRAPVEIYVVDHIERPTPN